MKVLVLDLVELDLDDVQTVCILGRDIQRNVSVCLLVPTPAVVLAQHCRASLNLLQAHRDVQELRTVQARSLFGHDAPLQSLQRAVFASKRAAQVCMKRLRATGCQLYDTQLSVGVRLLHLWGVGGAGVVQSLLAQPAESTVTFASEEYTVESHRQVSACAGHSQRVYVVMAFDIECLGGDNGEFPDARQPGHEVLMISSVVWNQKVGRAHISDVAVQRRVWCNSTQLEGLPEYCTCVASEAQLLLEWAQDLQRLDVDLVTGYNSSGFDLPYLRTRARVLGVDDDFERLLAWRCPSGLSLDHFLKDSQGQSPPGWVHLDLLPWLRRTMSHLRSFKLDDVAAALLGGDDNPHQVRDTLCRKVEVDVVGLTRKAATHRGDTDTWELLARYCLQDSELLRTLMQSQRVLETLVELAEASCIPMRCVLWRGQSSRVLSLVCREARKRGRVIPEAAINNSESKSKFQGATVLTPVTGLHTNVVACLDFASLYPSVIRAHNLCPTTATVGGGFAHGAPPGILPVILRDLADKRQAAKTALKQPGLSPGEAAMLDARQNAVKVTMNAMYGVCGSSVSPIRCKHVAAAVTRIGREMLEKTKLLMEGEGWRVLYGDTDSVMVDFGTKDPEEAQRLAEGAARMVTDHFATPPIKLCVDKLFRSLLLLQKKRYCARLLEEGAPLLFKGFQVVRHDACDLVCDTLSTALKAALGGDSEGCVDVLIAAAKELASWETRRGRPTVEDLKPLVISKKLRVTLGQLQQECDGDCAECGGIQCVTGSTDTPGDARRVCMVCGHRQDRAYKAPDSLPHVRAAVELARSQPGKLHQRDISFVYVVALGGPTGRQARRLAVHPDAVTSWRQLDLGHYLRSLLGQPGNELVQAVAPHRWGQWERATRPPIPSFFLQSF
jgi:DNA polymerase elongation subunit (family B)